MIYHTVAFQNLGTTIIVLAALSRILLYPVIKQQLALSKKMADIKPHLDAVKERHKGDKAKLQRAQMELFKQHGVNPAAGCLPSIVQIVVLFGLLGAINQILTKGVNINTVFWVWDMAKPDAIRIAGSPILLPGVLVMLAAATQYIQMKMMMPTAPKVRKEDKPAERKEKQDFQESFADAQSSTMWMFPLMFLLFGTQWPSGLALYWSVSSVLAIVQQYQVSGPGGLEPVVHFLKNKKADV